MSLEQASILLHRLQSQISIIFVNRGEKIIQNNSWLNKLALLKLEILSEILTDKVMSAFALHSSCWWVPETQLHLWERTLPLLTWYLSPFLHPTDSDHKRTSLGLNPTCIAQPPCTQSPLHIPTSLLTFLRPEVLLIPKQALVWNASPNQKGVTYMETNEFVLANIFTQGWAFLLNLWVPSYGLFPSAPPLHHCCCSLRWFSALPS